VVRVGGSGVGPIRWGPAGELAVGSDAEVAVIDRDGMPVRTLRPAIGSVLAVAFEADGSVIAAGSAGRDPCQTGIWREGRPDVVRILGCSEEVVLDPTGRRLVTLGGDGPALWDAETGVRIADLAASPSFGSSVTFSPDGSTIATGDGATIRLIDAATGTVRLTLRGHACAVVAVAFDAVGSHLASGTTCDAARSWILDVDELLSAGRASVTRSLTDAECRLYLHTEGC
jgi:WD40 repeat protein